MYIPDYVGEGKPLRRTRVYEGITVRKISSAPFYPVSRATVANHLKLDLAENPSAGQVTDEDATLDMLIAAVTNWWEHHMGVSILRATWKQTQDAIKDGEIAIRRGPVVAVTSIYTIPGYSGTDATPVLMSSTLYTVVGNSIVSDAWPAHRGRGSVLVTYTAGLVDWDAADPTDPTDEEIATAQAAVPEAVALGILNTIGHLYENREGQKPTSKYEVDAKLSGMNPPNTEMLGTGLRNISLVGKCWL